MDKQTTIMTKGRPEAYSLVVDTIKNRKLHI